MNLVSGLCFFKLVWVRFWAISPCLNLSDSVITQAEKLYYYRLSVIKSVKDVRPFISPPAQHSCSFFFLCSHLIFLEKVFYTTACCSLLTKKKEKKLLSFGLVDWFGLSDET